MHEGGTWEVKGSLQWVIKLPNCYKEEGGREGLTRGSEGRRQTDD